MGDQQVKTINFTEEYLSNRETVAAYNPDDVDIVYLYQQGEYIPFVIIESRFAGKSFEEASRMQQSQRELVKNATGENLQGRINLASNIEAIIMGTSKSENINLKNVRAVRQQAARKNHRDFVKEVRIVCCIL